MAHDGMLASGAQIWIPLNYHVVDNLYYSTAGQIVMRRLQNLFTIRFEGVGELNENPLWRATENCSSICVKERSRRDIFDDAWDVKYHTERHSEHAQYSLENIPVELIKHNKTNLENSATLDLKRFVFMCMTYGVKLHKQSRRSTRGRSGSLVVELVSSGNAEAEPGFSSWVQENSDNY